MIYQIEVAHNQAGNKLAPQQTEIINSSTKTQERKEEALESFKKECEDFIDLTVRIDQKVRGYVNVGWKKL